MTMMTKVTKNGINNSLCDMSVRLFSSGSAHLMRNMLMMSSAGRAGMSVAPNGLNQRCKYHNYLLLESEEVLRRVSGCLLIPGRPGVTDRT